MDVEGAVIFTICSTVSITGIGAYKMLKKKFIKYKNKYIQNKYNLFLDEVDVDEAQVIDVSHFNKDIETVIS